MAIYDSNKRYECEKCHWQHFRAEEHFLIEQVEDKSKLSSPKSYRKTNAVEVIVCCNCGAIVNKPVK